jgi:hypothetical protein
MIFLIYNRQLIVNIDTLIFWYYTWQSILYHNKINNF